MKILCEEQILSMVNGAKLGDEKKLEELIEYYTPYIMSKCGKNNIRGFDFEDLQSEAIKTLLKCLSKYNVGQTSFTNYFFRALSNEFNYLLRKSYNEEALGGKIYSDEERYEIIDIEDLLWKKELKEAVNEHIMALKGEEKEVIEGIFYREKTMAEIARSLKYPFYKVQHIRNLFLKRVRENMVGIII